MARKKKKRKTRVTKKDVKAARKELKMSSSQRKRRVIPGPWTETETELKVEAKMRWNNTGPMVSILGPSFGTYTSKDDVWGEKGWYPILFNLTAPNMKELVAKHGIDQFLAASEKALNEEQDEKGKPKYGVIIFLSVGLDGSQREDENKRFISVHAKTNKKSISGFRAIRKREYITLP